MASPAETAVLNTAELLERILVNLDMQTLLLSQRVSKQWKELIEQSPDLQKALFFELAPLEEGKQFGTNGTNTLLLERNQTGAIKHSHFKSFEYHYTVEEEMDDGAVQYELEVDFVKGSCESDGHESWRRMHWRHAVDPPLSFAVFVEDQEDTNNRYLAGYPKAPKGNMTFGEVIELAVEGAEAVMAYCDEFVFNARSIARD